MSSALQGRAWRAELLWWVALPWREGLLPFSCKAKALEKWEMQPRKSVWTNNYNTKYNILLSTWCAVWKYDEAGIIL